MLENHGCSITKAILTPLARILAHVGVTPNMMTVAGTVATIAIAVIYIPQGWTWQGGIVLAIMMFGDSVDGMLARMTADGTRFGAFLNSTSDRLGDRTVFSSLTAYAVFRVDDSFVHIWVIITGICSVVGAAAVPYARARAESADVVVKLGIAERTDQLIIGMGTAIPMSLGLPEWVFAADPTWVAFTSFVTVCQRIRFTAHNIGEGTP